MDLFRLLGAYLRPYRSHLAAIVILGLAYAVVTLYRRNNQLQDKMLDMAMTMGRENRDLMNVTNATVSASTTAITEMIRRMEDRR